MDSSKSDSVEHSSSNHLIRNPGDPTNHHARLPSTSRKIIENCETENSDTQTFSSNQEVELSINGVQFTISNQRRNGENVINMEVRVANNSSSKQGTISKNQQKGDTKMESKVDNSDNCIWSDDTTSLTGNVSMNLSNNMTSQPQSREIRKEVAEASSSSERKQMEKNEVLQTEIRDYKNCTETGEFEDQVEPKSIQCRKRKLPIEEIESSESCRVCGDEASKFIHYGGRSCQSCRAFFRRIVEKQSL